MGENADVKAGRKAFVILAQEVATSGSMITQGAGNAIDAQIPGRTRNVKVQISNLDAMSLSRALVAIESGKTNGTVSRDKAAEIVGKKYDEILAAAKPNDKMKEELSAALDEAAVRQTANNVNTRYEISTEKQANGNPALTDRMGDAGIAFKAKLETAKANADALDALVDKLPPEKAAKLNVDVSIEIGKVLMKDAALAAEVKAADDAAKATAAFDKIKDKLPPAVKAALAANMSTPDGVDGRNQGTAVAQAVPLAKAGDLAVG